MNISANLPEYIRSIIFPFHAPVVPPSPPHTIEKNPITVSKNQTKQTNSTENKFQPRKVDNFKIGSKVIFNLPTIFYQIPQQQSTKWPHY